MSWDDAAATWDDDLAVQAYSRAALRSLREVLDERGVTLAGSRVLDFGCGTGLLTAALAADAEQVIGLDTSAAMLGVLRQKGLSGVSAVSSLAEVAGTVDLITCSSVCAFVDDYPGTIRRLVERLAPGGLLVQWDWERDPAAEEPYGLLRAEIRAALVGAGLVDVAVDVGFREPFAGMIMAPLRGVGRKA